MATYHLLIYIKSTYLEPFQQLPHQTYLDPQDGNVKHFPFYHLYSTLPCFTMKCLAIFVPFLKDIIVKEKDKGKKLLLNVS